MNAYTLAALPPTLLLIARPQLWPWALAVAAFVALCALGAAAHVFREQRDEARAERDHLDAEADALAAAVHNAAGDIARLEAECNAHAATNAALVAEAALTDSATGTTVRVPLLRVVPAQRDSEHDRLALSRDEWDAIVRETEGI